MIVVYIILGLVVLLVLWYISTYNNLVSKKTLAEKAFKDIDVQLQNRFDLVPNLVSTVKGYMKHEEKTLTDIAKYRSAYKDAATVGEKAKVAGEMESALSRLLVTVESYPELKADKNFLELQTELKTIEQKIAYTRQFYNDAATKYNVLTRTIPSNFVAQISKFEEMALFEVTTQEAKNAVKVNFDE